MRVANLLVFAIREQIFVSLKFLILSWFLRRFVLTLSFLNLVNGLSLIHCMLGLILYRLSLCIEGQYTQFSSWRQTLTANWFFTGWKNLWLVSCLDYLYFLYFTFFHVILSLLIFFVLTCYPFILGLYISSQLLNPYWKLYKSCICRWRHLRRFRCGITILLLLWDIFDYNSIRRHW